MKHKLFLFFTPLAVSFLVLSFTSFAQVPDTVGFGINAFNSSSGVRLNSTHTTEINIYQLVSGAQSGEPLANGSEAINFFQGVSFLNLFGVGTDWSSSYCFTTRIAGGSESVCGNITPHLQALYAFNSSTSNHSLTADNSTFSSGVNWDDVTNQPTINGSSTTDELQDLWETISSDSGSSAANTQTDTLTIAGGDSVTTSVTGDILTIALDIANSIITSFTNAITFDDDITVSGEIFGSTIDNLTQRLTDSNASAIHTDDIAGGDLGGTYPNPTVVNTQGLDAANISSGNLSLTNITAGRITEGTTRFPQIISCGGTDKVSAFGADGTFTCTGDESGGAGAGDKWQIGNNLLSPNASVSDVNVTSLTTANREINLSGDAGINTTNLTLPGFSSCTALETDATGIVVCGADDTGAGGDTHSNSIISEIGGDAGSNFTASSNLSAINFTAGNANINISINGNQIIFNTTDATAAATDTDTHSGSIFSVLGADAGSNFTAPSNSSAINFTAGNSNVNISVNGNQIIFNTTDTDTDTDTVYDDSALTANDTSLFINASNVNTATILNITGGTQTGLSVTHNGNFFSFVLDAANSVITSFTNIITFDSDIIVSGATNTTQFTSDMYFTPSGLPFNFHDGTDLVFNVTGAVDSFKIEGDNAKMEMFENPAAANDFKVFEFFSKEGTDVSQMVIYKQGTGRMDMHTSSLRIGGVGNSSCSGLTSMTPCDTAQFGADLLVQNNFWNNGTIFGSDGRNNISRTSNNFSVDTTFSNSVTVNGVMDMNTNNIIDIGASNATQTNSTFIKATNITVGDMEILFNGTCGQLQMPSGTTLSLC